MIKKETEFLDAKILVIDDNPENVRLVERVLGHVGYQDVAIITDSGEALELIKTTTPDIVLLDLRMPKHDGFEILAKMRTVDSPLRLVPVLVFTADKSNEARLKAFEAGASDFLTKPGDVEEILLRVRSFLHLRLMQLQLIDTNEELETKVSERTKELSRARKEALEVLAHAAEFRDDVTGLHTKRVGELSAVIASQMGLKPAWIEALRLAALLHDVGKIAVPDSILLSPDKLDDSQRDIMRKHTVVANAIFSGTDSPLMTMALEIATCHHEHWDGSGYPAGLSGEQIPLAARIVGIADVYDALTNIRPYKRAFTHEEAVREIVSLRGSQFDPRVVESFLKVVAGRKLDQAA